MKKILILEDSKERILLFRRNFINAEIDYAKTAQEAIEFLKNNNNYFAVFLDHDLGDQIYTASNENSGYGVATWLEQNPQHKPENIFVHSLNSSGRANIQRALPEAKSTPFAWANKVNFARVSI